MDNKEETQNTEIFRKEAIEEQFSLSRLNQILVVVQRKEWIAFAVICSILFLFILWAFFGSIPIKVSGKGMILDLDQITTIQSQTDGFATNIQAKPGDPIREGQLLLELHNPILSYELGFYQMYADLIQSEYTSLETQVKKEALLRNIHLQQQLKSLQLAETNKLKEISFLKESLSVEEGLLAKNILTLPAVNKTRLSVLSAETEVEKIRTDLKENAFEIAQVYRQDELWNKENALRDAIRMKEEARLRFDQTQVRAPSDMRLVANYTFDGLSVTKGTPLMSLQKMSDTTPPRFFYAYVNSDVAKGILPGASARVELSKFLLKEYGYIYGKVKEVSILPVSDSDILAKLFNPSLVLALKSQSVTQVIIELERDPNTLSGYRWSSGKSPTKPITIGNVGKAYLVTHRIAPIYYLLPNLIGKEEGACD